MIDAAIADYLGSVVRAWCSSAAAWVAPGDASRELCAECIPSRFTAMLDLIGWPHAAVHPLVLALERVVADVQISLDEEHDEGIEHHHWTSEYFGMVHDSSQHYRAAAEQVESRVLAFRPLVDDVLAQCVAPRVDEYVAGLVESGMLALNVN